VVDAFAHVGVTQMTMPHSAFNVWKTLKATGLAL
jgi:carbon-monoxide dehydrogenase large subunit